jgi:N-acetylmuramic acid 6-phosphate etherase
MQPPEPTTEGRHPGTADLDEFSTIELVRLMNAEDARVAVAVAAELPSISAAIDGIAARMRRGGRLVYVGAGTSGRLGILDASECQGTFNTAPGQVAAIIAGGPGAVTGAVEDAEDDEPGGTAAMVDCNIAEADSVVGVTASGRTPFVIGALAEARRRGALIIALAANQPTPLAALADVSIAPMVGPEILTGSTRLKAGTAQKMVLNMLSTCVMVRLGKTFGNLMVDVRPTNAKLRERARRMVEEATGRTGEDAQALLDATGGDVKVAVVASLSGLSPVSARAALEDAGGVVRLALDALLADTADKAADPKAGGPTMRARSTARSDGDKGRW